MQAGEPYAVRVYLVNEGKKTVRLRGLGASITLNGQRSVAPIPLVAREVPPQQRALLGEVTGDWPEGVTSWTMDAVVTTDRDETGSSRLSWN